MSAYLVCGECDTGAEATGLFEVFCEHGHALLELRVCKTCGDRFQGEMEARTAARCELARNGVHDAMIDRIIDERIDRGELMPNVVKLLRRPKGEVWKAP